MIEAALYTLLIETEQAGELLSPITAIEYFAKMARYDNRFTETKIGADTSGRDIFAYSFGSGDNHCLFYAFPDPGEAVGARGLVALANLLQAGACNFKNMPVCWHFIPCLNFVDQPDSGKTLQTVRKTAAQEVDWCLNNPRPETTALMSFADKIRPVFTLAMHDEAHDNTASSSYLGVTKTLSPRSIQLIRSMYYKCGAVLNPDYSDKEMGDGFFRMDQIGDEFNNSTFSHLSGYGQVMVADVGKEKGLKISDLVFLQLAAGLVGMDQAISESADS